MSDKDQRPPQDHSASDRGESSDRDERPDGAQRHPHKPWRTEGLPTGRGDGDKPRRPRMIQVGADPVRKVSIIPRGRALGVTLSTPDMDRYGYDVEYLRGRIIGALGGMAAEQEVLGVVTTGAESDLEAATRIARAMVGRWGMSEAIGPVSVLPSEGDARMAGVSDELLNTVDQEVRRLIEECYSEARRLLRENRGQLDSIAEQLLAHETLDEADAYAAAGISHGART